MKEIDLDLLALVKTRIKQGYFQDVKEDFKDMIIFKFSCPCFYCIWDKVDCTEYDCNCYEGVNQYLEKYFNGELEED